MMFTLLLAFSLASPSDARVMSRCRSGVVAPRWLNKATVRPSRLSVRSSLSGAGRKPYPSGMDIKNMEAARKELARHCFGPSCSLESYKNVMPELSVDTNVHYVHPVDDMVREMERKRRELAEHCFGPSCNVEHYENLGLMDTEQEVTGQQESYKISPLYANRVDMEKKRKELQEHCFGPSCGTEHYAKMKIPEITFGSAAAQPKRIHPVEDTVREMERKRKELAKHCFGPSCNIKMYENVPRALAYLNQQKN